MHRRDAHSRARRRAAASATARRRTTPPTARSSSRATARSSRSSTRRGRCACIATSCSRSRWTAREGSAVAGLRGCKTQHRVEHAAPTWNPDIANPFDFYADWQDVPDNGEFDNAFKYQWEMFLRHVAIGDAVPSTTSMKARRACSWRSSGFKSWAEQRWLDVPALPRVGARPLATMLARSRFPALDGSLDAVHARASRATWPHAARRRSRSASRTRRRTSSPIRVATSTSSPSTRSTGTRRSRIGVTSGSTASRSPRRWTRRSAAGG